LARPRRNYRDTLAANKSLSSDLAIAMLDEGVLLLLDGRWYISTAHSNTDIGLTLTAAARIA
jgi:glutamate-1-semialdehyde aminotransferase